ncbi:MAG: preprotein translocase SecG subunit [Pseudomonadota bacterium]|jgi:preprotein translocase subunit SecG
MQVWLTLVLVLQLLSALAMIGLVLVQHGKGADMGASFGSGSSGSLFGATGSANFLSRSTAVCATIFFACTLALAFAGTTGTSRSGGGSVLDQPAAAASGAAPASAPAVGVIPGAAPAAGLPAAPAATPGSAPVPKQ